MEHQDTLDVVRSVEPASGAWVVLVRGRCDCCSVRLKVRFVLRPSAGSVA